MSGGTGITWPEFYDFLTGPAGCTEVGWHPGTHVTLRQPSGREFGTCKPSKTGYVSLEHFVAVANAFGKNRSDMEIWMGRRPPGKSKMTSKRAQRPIRQAKAVVTIQPVHVLVDRLHQLSAQIYRSPGVRRIKADKLRAFQEHIAQLEAWFIAVDSQDAA